MLPTLEAQYWAHEATSRIQADDRAFGAIMADINTGG